MHVSVATGSTCIIKENPETYRNGTRRELVTRFPRSKYVKHVKPFWNTYLTELKKWKVDAFRVWVSNNRPRSCFDNSFAEYKYSKKTFMKALKAARKTFENDQILKVIRTSEIDRNKFWKILQKARGGISSKASAIRGRDGKVVFEVVDVLNVWKTHFEVLGIPKKSPSFDNEHYVRVMSFINGYKKISEQ